MSCPLQRCLLSSHSAASTGHCSGSEPGARLTPGGGGVRPFPAGVSLQWEPGGETRPGPSRCRECYCFPRLSSPAEAPCESHCGGLTRARGLFLTSRPQWVALESAILWQLFRLPWLPTSPLSVPGHSSPLKEKLKGRPPAGWEKLVSFWSSPSSFPDPPLRALTGGFKRPGRAT